jgi:SAM-dependent methyltransferase
MLEDISSEEVLREEKSHGTIWNQMHGGYFSSPDIAAPFIAKIADSVAKAKPDVVVDLGGGTGFILDQLDQTGSVSDAELINLELSEEQLEAINNKKIIPKKGSIVSFMREELDSPEKHFFFICRSALHYSGLEGLKPLIKHIRQQLKPGEYFVHQTACFTNEGDADILNIIYDMMGTDKGYPTVRNFCRILEDEGFEVADISKAHSLELSSESLMQRYGFNEQRMQEIIDTVLKQGNEKEKIFNLTPGGFKAYLHYMIFTCSAV